MRKPAIAVVYDRKKTATDSRPAPIEIRVAWGGSRTYFTTGIRITRPQWNGKTMEVRRHVDAERMSGELRRQLGLVHETCERLMAAGAMTLERLRTALEGGRVGPDPLEWIEQRIAMRDVAESTRRQHMVMLRFMREARLVEAWSDFTLETIERMDVMLRRRTSNVDSVNNYHKRLRVYLDEAVRHGLLEVSPYSKFKPARPARVDTIKYLTEAERDALVGLTLDGPLEKARDVFVFCCYTGLAYSDMAKLRPEDIKRAGSRLYIEDHRRKTATPYRITLLEPAVAILEKWDWRLPVMSNVKLNYYLKPVGMMAGIDKPLTSHMARHTFATWALSRGVRVEVVSKMLAHSNIATTQIYAKILARDVDEGFEMLK